MGRATIVTKWSNRHPLLQEAYILNSWSDVTGQLSKDIGVIDYAYTIEAVMDDNVLVNIKSDNRFVVLWDITNGTNEIPPVLDAAGISALKANIQRLYYSDISSLVTNGRTDPVQITDALKVVQLRTPWKSGINVLVDEIYAYTDNVYQVIQAHKTQSDWTPPVAKSLFKRFYEPATDPWPWVQPLGSFDAYPINAKVTYGGYTWQSTIAANVWVPGTGTLWTNLTPPPVSPNWSGASVAYKINDLVIYVPNGFTYKCIQAHTSQAAWTPPAVPALWTKQ